MTTRTLTFSRCLAAVCVILTGTLAGAADNELTPQERKEGWILLFDGRSLEGWITSSEKPSQRPVEEGSLNPHRCGGYMLVHKQQWADFVLSLDYKQSKRCNSGVFVRTFSLKPRPKLDVGFNGLEIAIDDTKTAGLHDSGAIYDLVAPKRNAQKPIGEWNRMVIRCEKNIIEVTLNGQQVTRMDLDEFTEKNKRPDGTRHKFDIAYKDHPRKGYIGLQDHGADIWFKNIKLLPLK
jgi:hypothetical protein